MAREVQSLYNLNRGVVSRLGLARVDVKRLTLAAQDQTNWMARVLGQMSLRVGLQYLATVNQSLPTRILKFIFGTTDTALLEMTAGAMRVYINDVLLSRPTVATTITNGTFSGSLAGWTNMDQGGTVSQWAPGNVMQFQGDGTNRAIEEQAVTVANSGIEHGIRVVIGHGPVYCRIGSTSGDDDLLSETVLNTGTHSLSIVPIGVFYVRFFSAAQQAVWVSSCTIEAAGPVSIPTPWTVYDLGSIVYDQSADVVFAACKGYQQRRIERRGARPGGRSWSVCVYAPTDGPFRLQNITPTTLSPNAINGNVILTASAALFKQKHVNALFSITSVGQSVGVNASSANVWSPSVRITGLADQRGVDFVVSGTFVATVVVQRSFDNVTWATIGISFTAPGNNAYGDGLDNQIVYYRIGVDVGAYTSGTAVCSATAQQGSIRGVTRITGVASSTVATAEVLSPLGGTSPSAIWQEGQWSDQRGWPTSGIFHEGRLWWFGLNGVWGSVSDAYDSFDETVFGDSGPINRTIGSGPVDTINWGVSLRGLLIGGQGSELSIRANSLDEVLTPTNFNVKSSSNQGSGSVQARKIDQSAVFVDRSNCKVFDLSFDIRSYDFMSTDMMELAPELGLPGIVRMDVSRKPDTRIHCVRSDGTALVCVMSKLEDVQAWIPITTQGVIEDVCVLPAAPGTLDDQVYYVVARQIGNKTVRYLEKWALEVNCRGGVINQLGDAHTVFQFGVPTTTMSVPQLAGQNVCVWADGFDIGTNDTAVPYTQAYTVAGDGTLTLSQPVINCVVGLPYTAQFKSAKLGTQASGVSPLNRQKQANHIGLILADYHPQGLRFGPEYDSSTFTMDSMPLIEDGTLVGNAMQTDYDQNFIEFPGEWTTDLRVCLQAQAPRPVTVMAVTIDGDSYT